MDERLKVVHIGYEHSYRDIRIVMKECKTLQNTRKYEVIYVTSNKHGNFNGELYEDIKVKVLKLTNKGKVRFFHYLKVLKKTILSLDADIYHIHEDALLVIVPFLKRRGKKVIYDMHEDTANDWARKFNKYGENISKAVRCFVNYYERKMVKKSDGFIYVTPQFKKQGNGNTLEALIPNFPKIGGEQFPSFSIEDYIGRDNNICFAGGVSDIWNHSKIIKILSEIEDLRYNLAGGITEDFLKKLQELDGWEKVNYYGKIPFNEVKEIYNRSKIGMALLDYIWGEDHTGTLGNTKIYEFMQAGLPIICTDFDVWKEIVEKYHCGIYIEHLERQNIKDAIVYLLENTEQAYLMGQNGQKAIRDEYNWEKYENVLIELYNKVIKGKDAEVS